MYIFDTVCKDRLGVMATRLLVGRSGFDSRKGRHSTSYPMDSSFLHV
jgi:hypothetical protein